MMEKIDLAEFFRDHSKIYGKVVIRNPSLQESSIDENDERFKDISHSISQLSQEIVEIKNLPEILKKEDEIQVPPTIYNKLKGWETMNHTAFRNAHSTILLLPIPDRSDVSQNIHTSYPNRLLFEVQYSENLEGLIGTKFIGAWKE